LFRRRRDFGGDLFLAGAGRVDLAQDRWAQQLFSASFPLFFDGPVVRRDEDAKDADNGNQDQFDEPGTLVITHIVPIVSPSTVKLDAIQGPPEPPFPRWAFCWLEFEMRQEAGRPLSQ
jgi:hypothetical protein